VAVNKMMLCEYQRYVILTHYIVTLSVGIYCYCKTLDKSRACRTCQLRVQAEDHSNYQ